MATDKEIYEAMCAMIKRVIPGFEVRFKDKSWSQKLIGILCWPFNRQYMTRYITTVYPRVYFPKQASVGSNYRGGWKVLAHEYVHLWDRQHEGFMFNVRYAMPQLLAAGALLALGAIGAIWTPWCWLCLAALIFLIAGWPWGSKGRTNAEMRGYGMSMAVDFWRYGSVLPEQKKWVAKEFTGWSYYRMCPNEMEVMGRLDEIEAELKSNLIVTGEQNAPYREIMSLLKTLGAVS